MKNFSFLLIIMAAVCLSPCAVFAQKQVQGRSAKKETYTMRGVVSDSQGVLPGATVYLQNKDMRIIVGAVTGIQGEYILDVPANAKDLTIVTGFVGYVTQKVPYTGQRVYDVRLKEDSKSIQSVVVEGKVSRKNEVGVKRENLGTATEYLDVTQFEDMSVTSVDQMIQGRMANLDIVAASGDPGTVSTIRIRGSASLNSSNEPLIVIDGIPQDNEIDEDFNFGDANVEDFGALLSISPNDIQSIEILKDAAATALWGPRAANGVILIVTKQGGVHKPRFSFSQKFDYSFEPKPIPLLNGQEYVTLMQDALWNWIKDGDYAQDRVKKLTNQKDILYDRSYEYFNEFNCNTDWLDLISRNSLNSTTDFSMDGGGEVANYRFSLGYEDRDGTTKGTDYSRITSRLNLVIKFSRKFRVESKFDYTESMRNQPYGSTSRDLAIGATENADNEANSVYAINEQLKKPVRNTAMIKMPNMSPWVLDQYGNPTNEYFSAPESSLQGTFPNPLAHALESTQKTKSRSVGANFAVVYNPIPGLTVQGTVSYRLSAIRTNGFLPSSVMNVKWSNQNYNQGLEAQSNKAVTFADVNVNYAVNLGRHNIQATLRDQIEATNNNSYSITTTGSGAEAVSSPSSEGKIIKMNSAWAKRRTVGLVGSLNYVYDERYALNVAARLNANSNTGRNNRWSALRPSVSVVWRINNEKFMKQAKWVDELRLKASWGKSERVPAASFVTGTFAYEDAYMDRPSIKPNQMQLDNLRPEIVSSYNLGVEGAFLKNLIRFSFDYYNKETTDLIMENMAIQSTTGYSSVRRYNGGDVRNRGWEFSLSLNNIVKAGKFSLSLSNINLSRNVNEITSLPESMVAEKYTIGNGNYARKIMEGNPIGSIYGYIFEGVYQNYDETLARDASGELIRDVNGNTVPIRVGGTTRMHPGDAKYKDINHDGVIDERDIVYLGSSFPTITGGGSLVLKYKGWQLRTSLHFRLGHSIVNKVRHDLENMNTGNNQSKNVLRRWRYEGDDTDVPRALWGVNYNSMGSSKFVEDGSFLKIKDITLSYRIPQSFCSKLGITNAMLSLTTYNLFTFTNYSGQDPEVGVGAGAYGLAIDSSRTPPSRRVAFNISFSF